jgi:outer membrane PBP1 activator LpoA protein
MPLHFRPLRGMPVVLALLLAACAGAPQRPTAEPLPAVPSAAAPAVVHGWQPLAGYRQVAVLLPLSGPLAVAAAPVRDGLVARWLQTPPPRPPLLFIDTQGQAAGAVNAYREAVDAGADAVIGPLGRDEVEALLADPSRLSLPTLLLNRGRQALPAGAISYALSPEDEGETVAQAMRRAGLGRVLVLRGDDDSLRREADAFAAQFALNGGRVLATLDVRGKGPLLDAALAGAKAQGVDALFLALRGPAARQLAPALATAGLASMPRFASSQLSFGTGRSSQDGVLDGILFPTDVRDAQLAARAAVLPSTRGGGTRLYAFGHDAWLLFAAGQALHPPRDARVAGATGELWLAADRHVERDPAWATFRGGQRSLAPPPLAAPAAP